MPSWRLVAAYAPGNYQGDGVTLYVPPCGITMLQFTETWRQFIARDTYTLSKLFCRISANTITAVSTFRTRKNGGNGNQSVSIPASTTGAFEDLVNTDSLVNGDLFNYQLVTGATGTSLYLTIGSCILQTVSNNTPIIGGICDQTISTALTRYTTICGDQVLAATDTESPTQYIFRTSAILSNLRITLSANTITAVSTFRTRVNGGNGNQSVSIPASTTGAFEDLVNTDSLVNGDLFNYQLVTGATGGNLFARQIQIMSTSTGRQTANAAPYTLTLSYGLTRYLAIEGHVQYYATAEADVQLTMRMPAVAKNLFVRITTNSVNNSSTFRTRVNGGNGNLSVSVGASATGAFEDTTNSDSLATTDVYNLQIVTGGTSGSMVITIFGFELQQPAVGWTGKISGVTNPAKIMGVDVANIAKVKGVA